MELDVSLSRSLFVIQRNNRFVVRKSMRERAHTGLIEVFGKVHDFEVEVRDCNEGGL